MEASNDVWRLTRQTAYRNVRSRCHNFPFIISGDTARINCLCLEHWAEYWRVEHMAESCLSCGASRIDHRSPMKVPVRQLVGHLQMINDIRDESSDDFQVNTTKVRNAVAPNAKKGHGIDAIQLLSYYASSYR